MVLAAVQGPRSQGVYGLVANLGSLVVRTLFQPFEEAAFTAFSQAGAAGWFVSRWGGGPLQTVVFWDWFWEPWWVRWGHWKTSSDLLDRKCRGVGWGSTLRPAVLRPIGTAPAVACGHTHW